MKEIKIILANAQKIEAVLREINLKSAAHTYTQFVQIEALSSDAESRLTSLLKAKKHFTGAVFAATSGGAVAISYKYSRDATSITLMRKLTGWFLTDAISTKVYKDGGKKTLRLTAAQDAIVHKETCKKYELQPNILEV
jgi:hypothetical protein